MNDLTGKTVYQHIDNHITADLRAVFNDGAKAYLSLLRDDNWENWLRIGHSIAAAQDLAIEVTGQSSGRGFNSFMTTWYGIYPECAKVEKSARSYAVKCWRERAEINEWRNTMGESQKLRLNHPQTVYKAYERRTIVKGPTAEKVSPYAKLQQAVIKLEEENHTLKKQARGRDGDVHFSLLDKDAAIADTLVMALKADRAKNVAEHIRRKLGKKVETVAA